MEIEYHGGISVLPQIYDQSPGDPAKGLPPVDLIKLAFTAEALQKKDFPPIKYVIPGFVPEGVTILAGKPKLGKSWMTLDFSLAVAFGGVAFGSIQCEQGDVLHMALEDNPRRLQSRLYQMLGDTPWPKRLTFLTQCDFIDEGVLELIHQLGPKRVTVHLSVLLPCPEEARISKAFTPIGFVGRQALPVGRKLIQQFSGVIDVTKTEHRLDVLHDNISLLPVIGNPQGLRKDREFPAILQKLPQREGMQRGDPWHAVLAHLLSHTLA